MNDHDEIRRRLRAGDPAGAQGLDEHERAALRARVVAAANASGTRRVPFARLAWAGLALAAACALAFVFGPRGAREEPRPVPVAASKPAAPATPRAIEARPEPPRAFAVARTPHRARTRPNAVAVAKAERRQIQFTTPGGTRIIWIVNPDLPRLHS